MGLRCKDLLKLTNKIFHRDDLRGVQQQNVRFAARLLFEFGNHIDQCQAVEQAVIKHCSAGTQWIGQAELGYTLG